MADPVTAAIAFIGAELGGEIGAVLILNAVEIGAAVSVAATVASIYNVRDQQRRAQNAARDAFNASLRDRYIMTRGATEPRQLVLGRARVSGPLFFAGSYGTNKEKLVYTLALAGHEIDAVEAIYFDDHLLTLDGSGNVIGVQYEEQFSISATSATFTLQSKPKAGSVTAVVTYNGVPTTLGTSISGNAVTVTGASGSATGLLLITYQPDPCPFLPAQQLAYFDTFSLSTLSGTFTLPRTPDAGTVTAAFDTFGDGVPREVLAVSGSATTGTGTSVTVNRDPGASPTLGTVTINYQSSNTTSKARIRSYLGSATQAADAGLIAALPGVWTSAHTASGVAYLVVELDYDPDAFQAQPNVSARIRGAKVLDPRTGATAFSTNPALLARHAALHPLCGRLSSDLVNDPSIITAANICDQATAYVVNGQRLTRPRFAAGTVHKAGGRPQDTLKALCDAMAGEHVFIEGLLRLKAGAYSTPLQTLDESWLSKGQAVKVQPQRERSDVFNVITGTFADEGQKYQVVEFPRVAPAEYIAADGGVELPLPVQLDAVQFSGQAQFVCAIRQRDARQPLTLTVLCNLRAYACEVFDVINVSLARFGWVNKPFEVRDASFTLDGGIQLVLKETSSTIFDIDAGFSAQDPAPNTRLPSPFAVADVPGLAAASGTTHLLKQADGSIVSRVLVSWGAIADAAVLASTGAIEVRYGLASLGDAAHRSIEVPGVDRQVYLSDVLDGAVYLIKARARNALVAGKWTSPLAHKVIGKTAPPANVAGLTGTVSKGRILWTWEPSQEVDYAETEVRSSDANWGAASPAPLFRGSASNWVEIVSATGTYTRYVRHFDTTGNPSAASTSASITVTAGDLVQDGGPGINAATIYLFQRTTTSTPPSVPSATVTYTFATGGTSGVNNGWLNYLAGSGGSYRWLTQATALGTGATDTIATGEWSTPQLISDATGALASLNTVGTGQIDASAATEVTQDSFDFAGTTTGSGVQTARTLTVTPPVDSTVEFTSVVAASNVYGDSGSYLYWTVQAGAGSETTLTDIGSYSTAKQNFTSIATFAATGGVALTFRLKTDRPSGNPAIALFTTATRITLIKR